MSPRARATLSLFGGWNSARGGAMHLPRPTFHSVASAASRCCSVEALRADDRQADSDGRVDPGVRAGDAPRTWLVRRGF